MGRLTTHVLDTARGRPAAGMAVALARIGAGGSVETLMATKTNADGRCDAPLLEGAAFTPGVYELHFEAGAYFRASGVAAPEPMFVDAVILRFGIADATEHYHVPLLVSPYAYSTYRGS
jgi:5-hydroxyisourate hydrolase